MSERTLCLITPTSILKTLSRKLREGDKAFKNQILGVWIALWDLLIVWSSNTIQLLSWVPDAHQEVGNANPGRVQGLGQPCRAGHCGSPSPGTRPAPVTLPGHWLWWLPDPGSLNSLRRPPWKTFPDFLVRFMLLP